MLVFLPEGFEIVLVVEVLRLEREPLGDGTAGTDGRPFEALGLDVTAAVDAATVLAVRVFMICT